MVKLTWLSLEEAVLFSSVNRLMSEAVSMSFSSLLLVFILETSYLGAVTVSREGQVCESSDTFLVCEVQRLSIFIYRFFFSSSPSIGHLQTSSTMKVLVGLLVLLQCCCGRWFSFSLPAEHYSILSLLLLFYWSSTI